MGALIMIEVNPVNLKQTVGLLGTPEKLQKGKAGKDAEQMMPFVCVMGQACRAKKAEKILPDPHLGNGKIKGRSNKGNATRQDGVVNIDPENNILGAGKGKTEKTNQSLPMKDTETKINKSFSGKIDLLSKKDSQNQIQGEVKDLQGSGGLKKSKTETIPPPVLTGNAKGPLNPVLNKQNIESGLTKSGLIKAVVEKKETPVHAGTDALIGSVKEQALSSGIGNKKGNPPVFKEAAPGFLKTGLQNSVAVKGKTAVALDKTDNNAFMLTKNDSAKIGIKAQGSEIIGPKIKIRGQKAKTETAPGLLKTGLQNSVAVKGKTAAAPDKTENNAFVLTKNDSAKNEIKNILTPPGLKRGETIEVLHRETSPPDHSSGKVSSAGGYHHTAFHSSGASTAVNESVKSQAIEPRILINQIASGVKRPGRMRLTLNPPRLGTLDVDVLVRNNKVQVMLHPENNDVRQILQSNVESLKSAFRNHGLVADTINVSVQEKSDGANYSANYRSGQNETLFKEGGNWGGNQENHGSGQDSMIPDPISLKEENPLIRNDDQGGRVSLFA